MRIVSSAFENNQPIPSKYTCDGSPPAGGVNPPLEFLEVPQNALSLVLIMDDPDAPKSLMPDGLFVHWLVFNIPPLTKFISENQTPPGIQGVNSAGVAAYTGPCPPDREHRYFFKFYALDTTLNFGSLPGKAELETAIKGHCLAQCELVGKYEKIL